MMTDLAKLIPGREYRVAAIVKDNYLLLEGFETSLPVASVGPNSRRLGNEIASAISIRRSLGHYRRGGDSVDVEKPDPVASAGKPGSSSAP
jgi:hypothetical protein